MNIIYLKISIWFYLSTDLYVKRCGKSNITIGCSLNLNENILFIHKVKQQPDTCQVTNGHENTFKIAHWI